MINIFSIIFFWPLIQLNSRLFLKSCRNLTIITYSGKIRVKNSALFMYHYHKNSLQTIFRNFFFTFKTKNVVTRSNSQIIPVSSTFTVSKQSVKFWGPRVWNQLPTDAKKSNTVHSFLRNIQPYLAQRKIKL